MRKICICILAICTLLLTCGCGCTEAFKYLHSADSIQKIEIVELTQKTENGFEQKKMCIIDNVDAFIDDFETVDCYRHFMDPLGVDEGDIAIKLIYNNGDYELVTNDGKAIFYADSGIFRYYKGYQTFDDEQFQALLDKYISKAN